jgi:hypothetical protein
MKIKTRCIFTAITLFFSAYLPQLSAATDYPNPQNQGYSLDWCKTFEKGCGKPAADAFCQRQGFSKALDFVQDRGVNVSTMIISNNAICNPVHHRCDSFKVIRCQ